MIEYIFQKELILIKQMHQKSVIFVIIGIFLDTKFNYEPCLCNGCHNLMQKAMNFNDATIVSIKGNDYRIHFWYMSKDDGISIMKNSSLNEKAGSISIFFHYI